MLRLTAKVAIVTGSSTGIGAGIARALAAEGASVVVNYASNKSDAETVVAAIIAVGGKAIAVQADVSIAAQAQALIDAAIKHFGQIDILVNNSGIYSYAPLEAITEEAFHRHFNINVLGLLLVTQAASPHLKEGASIINIGSSITRVLPAASAVYSATKGAVNAITGVLTKEFGPRRIRVNSINPGLVLVDRAVAADLDKSPMFSALIAQTPLGRVGYPNDIAKAAVFLASDEAAWITGELLHVSGGL